LKDDKEEKISVGQKGEDLEREMAASERKFDDPSRGKNVQ
jgi:hypothetical protein